MGKFFIDGGAHQGESVKLFKSQYPNSEEFKIISFEANPGQAHHFQSDEFSNVEFHNVAISTTDGEADFYHHEWSVGMTLCKHNYRVLLEREPLKVKTIDFSKWLIKNFSINDYIILKLDIEGAEYDVIEKMFDDGSIRLIKKLYIEWHHYSYGVIHPMYDMLVQKLQKIGIKDLYWCAGPGRTEILEKDVI